MLPSEMTEKLREMAKVKRMSAELLGDVLPVGLLPEQVQEKMLQGEYRDYLLTPLSVEQNSDADFFTSLADDIAAGKLPTEEQAAKLQKLAERADDFADRQGWELEKYDDLDELYEEYKEEEDEIDDPDQIRDNIDEAREEATFFRAVAGLGKSDG